MNVRITAICAAEDEGGVTTPQRCSYCERAPWYAVLTSDAGSEAEEQRGACTRHVHSLLRYLLITHRSVTVTALRSMT